MGHEAEWRALDPRNLSDGVKNGRIGTRRNHGVRKTRVEPPGSVVVAEPRGHEHRVVGHLVALLEQRIHSVAVFADVVVIDTMNAANPGIAGLEFAHLFPAERGVRRHASVRHDHGIHRTPEIETHFPACKVEESSQLRGPLVCAPPRPAPRTQVERHRGCTTFIEHHLSGKTGP